MPEKFYVAIVNQRGYLPESDPAEFCELSDAESYLCDDLRMETERIRYDLESGYINRTQAAISLLNIRQAMRDVRRHGLGNFGDYAYEIQERQD